MKLNDIFPSKYLNHADLDGGEMAVVIERIELESFTDRKGVSANKPVLYFQGMDKGLGCNKTNAGTIAHLYGDETDDWIGREIILFPSVTTGPDGKPVDCVRVRGPLKRTVQRTSPAAPLPTPRTQTHPQQMARHPMPGDRGDDEPPPWEPMR